jgi:hypothetical protein
MPRFFFHLEPFGVHDAEGQEFSDDEAARQEASKVVAELARNRTPSPFEQLVVTNEHGEAVFVCALIGSERDLR